MEKHVLDGEQLFTLAPFAGLGGDQPNLHGWVDVQQALCAVPNSGRDRKVSTPAAPLLLSPLSPMPPLQPQRLEGRGRGGSPCSWWVPRQAYWAACAHGCPASTQPLTD